MAQLFTIKMSVFRFIALLIRTRWLLSLLLEDQPSDILWLQYLLGGIRWNILYMDLLGGPNMATLLRYCLTNMESNSL